MHSSSIECNLEKAQAYKIKYKNKCCYKDELAGFEDDSTDLDGDGGFLAAVVVQLHHLGQLFGFKTLEVLSWRAKHKNVDTDDDDNNDTDNDDNDDTDNDDDNNCENILLIKDVAYSFGWK